MLKKFSNSLLVPFPGSLEFLPKMRRRRPRSSAIS